MIKMYWYVIFILAQTASCPTASAPPTSASENRSADSAQPNLGWWLTSQCKWERRPCPVARPSDAVVQRLPLGCPAIYPTIAYTVGADLKIRKDFAEANTRIQGLQGEVTRGRLTMSKLTKDTIDLVERGDRALTTCVDAAQLQSKALSQAERQLFWSRVTVATSIVTILTLSVVTAVYAY